MAMLLVTRLVTGLALDRAALPAMRGTTRALRLHSPVLQARSPVTVAAGAVEVTTAVPLTTATFAASDAAASEWSGDMMIVPLWQADKGERPTLGPSAQALDDKLAGLRAPSPSPYPYPYPRRPRPAPWRTRVVEGRAGRGRRRDSACKLVPAQARSLTSLPARSSNPSPNPNRNPVPDQVCGDLPSVGERG